MCLNISDNLFEGTVISITKDRASSESEQCSVCSFRCISITVAPAGPAVAISADRATKRKNKDCEAGFLKAKVHPSRPPQRKMRHDTVACIPAHVSCTPHALGQAAAVRKVLADAAIGRAKVKA